MTQYWEDHPALHNMVAAYMGIKSKNKAAKSKQDVQNMMSELAGAGFVVQPGKRDT